MAGRRKITIEEAMQTLQKAGLHVDVRQVDTVEEPAHLQGKKGFKNPTYPVKDASVQKQFNHRVKITLHAKHSVGSGGTLGTQKEGYIENAGVQTYGPGIVVVPERLAQHLLHQDMLARAQDDRFLDRTQRSYIVMQKQTADGSRANVGQLVDNSLLDSFSLNGPVGIIIQ